MSHFGKYSGNTLNNPVPQSHKLLEVQVNRCRLQVKFLNCEKLMGKNGKMCAFSREEGWGQDIREINNYSQNNIMF